MRGTTTRSGTAKPASEADPADRGVRRRLFAAAGAAALASCAMTDGPPNNAPCEVEGAERLPAGSGGAPALCAAIDRAMRDLAPGAGQRVEVRVLSASRLSATLTMADGTRLPEIGQAKFDRPLDPASFERLAMALARAAASHLAQRR